jgi:hypothetical protein
MRFHGLLQMISICNKSVTLRSTLCILCIGVFSCSTNFAKAACVANQSEVAACLSGTAVAGDYAGAVIQEDGQPGLRQVIQGDIVAGWKVDEIGAGYVELKRGTRTTRLEMPQPGASNVEEVQADTMQTDEIAPPLPAVTPSRPIRHSVIAPAAAGD